MNLRQLEILRAIVRYGTTVATAQALGLSQPAISNAIKTMEEQVGFALFQRLNNRIYPTPEAKLLLSDAESIFETHKRLERRIHDLRTNRAGQLRIVATPPLGYGAVARAIREMQIKKPRVQTFFDVRSYSEVLDRIETHHSELGFVVGYKDQAGLKSETLYRGEMVCVMRPDHPLASHAIVDVKALQKHRFIALERGTQLGNALRLVIDQAEDKFRSAVEVRAGLTACTLADAGVGVAVVDPLTASSSGKFSLVSRPFSPSIPISASVVWAESRSLSRLANLFVQEVRKITDHHP
ncbi:LysR family transcriptional regulator [Lichenicola cladoniae]|uniref:LysR family transcriptional regulator n=2 Tax=Lichenicola cladoniae TaxID=1484109 RepID=A0A6M8HVK9_9PROT|nr:LysR family transcriptional regulator [Acetobacteraceae bacterium]QKE92402.1 LysR family transcriptional regulator [Lichenicola cladoniae]